MPAPPNPNPPGPPSAQQYQEFLDAVNRLEQLTGSPQSSAFNFNAIANDANLLANTLTLINNKIQQISGETDYLDQSFGKVVDTMRAMLPILALHRAAIKPLESQAENLLRIKRGEADFNYKNYLIYKDQNAQAIKRLELEKSEIDTKINLGGLNANELAAWNAKKTKINDQIADAKYVNNQYEESLKLNNKINKELGVRAVTVTALDSLFKNMGLPDLGFEDAWKETQRLAQEAEAANVEFDPIATFTQIIGRNLTAALNPTELLQKAVKKLYETTIAVDKSTGELAKSFGTSYAEAASLRNELNTIANLSNDININTASLQKALIELNKQFGTATMLNGELLKDYTRLTEVAGYTAEAAAGLSKITVATGTDLSENTSEILGQAVAFNAVNGLALNEKEIVEAVAKTSAATTLSLGMQPGKIAEANLQAKALGTTLEKVEQIASSLLQFESSIEAELSAELLVGKDLYLERARLFALNNNMAGVAEEIAKQVGSAADFTNMNVLQQEALAKAVGMTREDLAKSLIEREALAAIGEGDKTALEAYTRLKKEGLSDDQIAAKLGDDKLASQLKSQSVQERFNKSVEKLQEVFVSLAEPILQIVSPFMDLVTNILPLINIILTPALTTIKYIGESIAGWLNFLNGGLDKLTFMQKIVGGIGAAIVTWKVATMAYAAAQTIAAAITAITAGGAISTMSALTLGIGVASIIGGLLLGIGAMKSASKDAASSAKTANDMVSPGYGKRTLLAPEGAIALNDKDTVIAGTKLFKGNDVISAPQGAINMAPPKPQPQLQPILVTVNNSYDGTQFETARNVSRRQIQ